MTLHLLWNFLATRSDRTHWYEHGAVPLAVDTFFDSEHEHLPMSYHPRLLELSIGVLAQLS